MLKETAKLYKGLLIAIILSPNPMQVLVLLLISLISIKVWYYSMLKYESLAGVWLSYVMS